MRLLLILTIMSYFICNTYSLSQSDTCLFPIPQCLITFIDSQIEKAVLPLQRQIDQLKQQIISSNWTDVNLNNNKYFDVNKSYRIYLSLFDPYINQWIDNKFWQTGMQAINSTLIIFKIPITGRLPSNQIFLNNQRKNGEDRLFKVHSLQAR